MKSKSCKIFFLYYQFVYILTAEGENVTATLLSRLLSEHITHPERVATWQLERENDNSKTF